MAAVDVTNVTLTLNTEGVFASDAATETVINTAQAFNVTPTKADNKVLIGIVNGAGHGALAWSIAAGGFWGAGAAKTGSCADGKTEVIVLEGGKYASAAGVYVITLTPATGKILLTNHAAAVYAIELP
jgi:hypothetical protein